MMNEPSLSKPQSFREHAVRTLDLAYPVAIGQLGHVMLGVVDSVMVGAIGTTPLAAASLVNSLFFLLFVTGVGISYSITPLVAIAHGENDLPKCGRILRHGLAINILTGLLFLILGFILSEALWYFNQPVEVAEQASSYLRIMSLLYIPMMMYHAFRQFIEGQGYTRPPMFIAIAANGVNVFGNWVFIYGNLGMPALGLDGAGWSSVLTECLMLFALMLHTLRSPKYRGANISLRMASFDFSLLKKMLKIGLPGGAQYFFEVSAFSLSAIMIGWTGSASLAAHQVGISLASVTYMIVLGISIAASIRVGNALGRKAMTDLRRAGFTAIFLAACLMAVFGLCFIVLRDVLPAWYVNDPDVLSIASTLLVIAAAFQLLDGVQAASMGALRGITDVTIPSVMAFIGYWLIALPVGYFTGIALGYGAPGVWIGFICGLLTVAVLFTLRFHRKSQTLA